MSEPSNIVSSNNNSDVKLEQYGADKSDLVLYGSPVAIRTNRNSRRGSSFVKNNVEEITTLVRTKSEEGGREDGQMKSQMRRGSSFIRMMSGDSDDYRFTGRLSRPDSRRSSSIEDDLSRRSSKSDTRRESNFGRISEENGYEEEHLVRPADAPDQRRSFDTAYRTSLECITECRPQATSPSSYADYSGDKESDCTYSSLSYLSWIESIDNSCKNIAASQSVEGESRSGEWSSFWSNYNSARNDFYLCPSNSMEEVSTGSNCSMHRGCKGSESVVLTIEEVTEALDCTQRLTDILKAALRRADLDESEFGSRKNSSKEKRKYSETAQENQKQRNDLKPPSSCIDIILNHTGVADILKKVIARRSDIIMSE